MDFFESLKNTIDSRDFERFKTLLYDEKNEPKINEFAWDITSLFCDFLAADANNNENSEHFEHVHEASLHLCRHFGNAKEIILAFEEAAESLLTTDRNFMYFVDISLTLFGRLSLKIVSHSFELALPLLNNYLQKLFRLNDEQRATKLLGKLFDFVDNVCLLEATDHASLLYKDTLKTLSNQFIVNYFYEPFFVNMQFETDEQSISFDSLKQAFELFVKLNRDFLKAIRNIEYVIERQEKEREISESDEENASGSDKKLIIKYSTGSLIYFAVKTFPKSDLYPDIPIIPLVYEKSHIFFTFVRPIQRLLEKLGTNNLLQMRCFDALNFLISSLDLKSIPESFLEIGAVFDILMLLFKIAIYNTKETVRKTAINLIKSFFFKLNRKARLNFIKMFWKQSDLDETMRIYLRSFLVYLFKEEINDCFNEHDQFYFTDSFRTTSHFNESAQMIIALTNKVATDLVNESSLIVATLNLIRFIILRDRDNRIALEKSNLADEYLRQLEKAIQISKAHYDLEQKKMLSQPKVDTKQAFSVKTLSNEEIEEPTRDEKLVAIQSAIHQLDMIECLRIRVNEIIAEKKKN
jgi:hypothetical protein